MLDTNFIKQYNNIISELLHSQTNLNTSSLINSIEAIEDSMDDLHILFKKDPNQLKHPLLWLDLIRVIKFSISKNKELNKNYDSLVNAYQNLTIAINPDEDQKKLKKEISELMYKIDDFNGTHERQIEKFLTEIAKKILQTFQKIENTEDLHSSKIDTLTQQHFQKSLVQFIDLITKYDYHLKISEALERMIQLIIK